MVKKISNSMLESGGVAAGVATLTAGTNIMLGGTPTNPIINSTSSGGVVTSITAGTGVSVTGTAAVPIVTNTGVVSVTAGTGVSVGGSAGAPVITNSGVLSVTAGSNVSITGTASNPIVNAVSGGVVVQRKYSSNNTSVVVSSDAAALDNSNPLRTESQLVVSQTITPTSGSNYIDIEGYATVSSTQAAAAVFVGIFESTTSEALAVSCAANFATGGYQETLSVRHRILATNTSARTYEIRVGTNYTSGNLYVNGFSGGPLYSTSNASRILVEEATP